MAGEFDGVAEFFADDAEKCLCLGPERAVSRMNQVEAATKRFGIGDLDRDQTAAMQLTPYGHLRKK